MVVEEVRNASTHRCLFIRPKIVPRKLEDKRYASLEVTPIVIWTEFGRACSHYLCVLGVRARKDTKAIVHVVWAVRTVIVVSSVVPGCNVYIEDASERHHFRHSFSPLNFVPRRLSFE